MGRLLAPDLRPEEAWEFWDAYDSGFSLPFRDLRAEDVRAKTRLEVRKAVGQLLTPQRHRFLAKVTGWPRIGWFDEIFDDARFVHMVRDGRAWVNSILGVPWWKGWQGPWNWRWGPLSAEHRNEWEASGRSFVVLAAIEWKVLMEATEIARKRISEDRFFEVRYEQLCAQPKEVLSEILEFCELPASSSLERVMGATSFENANRKWTEDLTADQQKKLQGTLQSHLVRYGFVDPGP